MLGTKKTIKLKHNLRIIIVFMKATNDFFSEKRIDIGGNSVKVKIIYIARKKNDYKPYHLHARLR